MIVEYNIPRGFSRRFCAAQAIKLQGYADRSARCAKNPRWQSEATRLLSDATDYSARAAAWRKAAEERA